ncbi:ester cyclase [Frankia sp. Mgl5]|uniref:ester cyclase n=1 Tax=Frankia sp. Mgl5 TaxID=2933793 RepID=UPI00200ECDBD|nr:ester cyclase [Frankia sp. Mgl5]MCK9926976.1 ester cyclase [Frankia sp. Mgl5]
MAGLVSKLMDLWSGPPVEGTAEKAFGELYTDPVIVNGTALPVGQLAERAGALHAAFSEIGHEILDHVQAPGREVVAFRLRGRHTGTWVTPLGEVAPTGRVFEARVIDILHITDGRVAEVWSVPEELGLLTQLGAVSLVGP